MQLTTFILTALAVASIYPLIFWLPYRNLHRQDVRKWNITIPNIMGGFVLVSVWLIEIPIALKIIVTIWKMVLIYASRYSWKQDYPDPKLMTIPCLLGIYIFFRLKMYLDVTGIMP